MNAFPMPSLQGRAMRRSSFSRWALGNKTLQGASCFQPVTFELDRACFRFDHACT